MDRPKLRKVDRIQHRRGDEDLVVVRDPLGLAEPFALDAELAPVLDLLDGAHTLAQIRQSLLLTQSLDLPVDDLAAFVGQLRDQALLDDDAFRRRWAATHAEFLEAPTRASVVAGLVYPDDPDALAAALERAIPSDPPGAPRIRRDSPPMPPMLLIGALVPHGPLPQVGALLDETLRGLPPPESLEHIVILGTDHSPGLLPYAVTAKPYATPRGLLPVATDLVAALERRVPWILREEIRHRNAISIELAAVVLQHLYGDRCPPILPVLCGATALGVAEQALACERFELALGGLCEDRAVLWWVSAELSHAGPAYGRPSMTRAQQVELQERDSSLLTALRTGDEATLSAVAGREHAQGTASGGPALAAAIRMLPSGYRGELVRQTSYEAPGDTPGVVGVGGVRLFGPRAHAGH